MKKQEVLEILDRLPDEIDPERFMDELYVRLKLDRSEIAVADGQVVSQEEAVARSREWFK